METTPTASRPLATLPKPPATCLDERGKNYKSTCKLNLADRIIAESTAVLKNDGNILPLPKSAKVALVGSQACAPIPVAQGNGNGFACNDVTTVNVRDGIAGLPGAPHITCNRVTEDTEIILIVVAPALTSEGSDRKTLQLNVEDARLINAYSGTGKKVVVAMNAPGPMITSTWDAGVAALVVSWLPGQQNGRGIAMALYNEGHEASGRLPFTFPKCSTMDCIVSDERASVALGDQMDADSTTHIFTEKALIGYRWYHAQNREVSFPFGFGLFAYGSAEVKYSGVNVVEHGDGVKVACVLEQSGRRAGHDVPQLYLSFPDSVPGDANSKPEWVLKGFTKILVHPGVPETASFQLSRRDLSYWDDGPGRSLWVCAKGSFRVCVGANARDAIEKNRGSCTAFTATCGDSNMLGQHALSAEDSGEEETVVMEIDLQGVATSSDFRGGASVTVSDGIQKIPAEIFRKGDGAGQFREPSAIERLATCLVAVGLIVLAASAWWKAVAQVEQKDAVQLLVSSVTSRAATLYEDSAAAASSALARFRMRGSYAEGSEIPGSPPSRSSLREPQSPGSPTRQCLVSVGEPRGSPS